MNPRILALQNLFVDLGPVKIKEILDGGFCMRNAECGMLKQRAEVRGRKDRRLEVEKMRKLEGKGTEVRNQKIRKKIRRAEARKVRKL